MKHISDDSHATDSPTFTKSGHRILRPDRLGISTSHLYGGGHCAGRDPSQ